MCLGALARALPGASTATHELLLRELETHVTSTSDPHYVRAAAAVAFALALVTRKRSAALVTVTALVDVLCTQLRSSAGGVDGLAWGAATAAGTHLLITNTHILTRTAFAHTKMHCDVTQNV